MSYIMKSKDSSSSTLNSAPQPSPISVDTKKSSKPYTKGTNTGSMINHTNNGQLNGSRNRNPNDYSKRRTKKRDENNHNHGQHNKNTVTEVSYYDEFETSFLNSNGRKAVDISHLLNFSFDDHDSHNNQPDHYTQMSRRRHNKNNSSNIHLSPRNYINVNYKFIVDPKGDYRPQILDPNVPLEESSILRVIVPKNDTQCPICLSDELTAPRMTRCGHIFCYPCLLRLFSNKDEKAKHARCPLCQEDIKESHRILPVIINEIDERYEKPVAGEEVILQLMCRDSSKILSLPYKLILSASNIYKGNIPWIIDDEHITPDNFLNVNCYVQFSRLMKSGLSFINKCFLNEIEDIKKQYEEDKESYGDEGMHYQMAILKIQSTMDVMSTSFDDVVEPRFDSPHSPSDISININNLDNSAIDSNHGPHDLLESIELLKIDELTERQEAESEKMKEEEMINPHDTGKIFFYYQTAFNSKVKFFLSMLDVQIMKELYGDYSLFPLNFKVKVESINYTNSIVTNDIIQRYKYLGHLPIGTEIAFIELDWFEKDDNPERHNQGNHNRSRRRDSKYKKSLLPSEVYQKFKKKLVERSTKTRSKLLREEHNKILSEKELELKTLQFYSDENNMKLEDYGYLDNAMGNDFHGDNHLNNGQNFFASLGSTDATDRTGQSEPGDFGSPTSVTSVDAFNPDDANRYESTVWGTKILKSQTNDNEPEFPEVDFDSELIIQQAKEEGVKKGKGKKKRIVVNFF